MNTLIPLWDNVLVQAITQPATSASGILLPESKEKPWYGTVIAVWEWKQLDNGILSKPQVAVWDIVYFTKYGPDEIIVDGQTYLIIKSSSILAKQMRG
jgi:chaperonin GroES